MIIIRVLYYDFVVEEPIVFQMIIIIRVLYYDFVVEEPIVFLRVIIRVLYYDFVVEEPIVILMIIIRVLYYDFVVEEPIVFQIIIIIRVLYYDFVVEEPIVFLRVIIRVLYYDFVVEEPIVFQRIIIFSSDRCPFEAFIISQTLSNLTCISGLVKILIFYRSRILVQYNCSIAPPCSRKAAIFESYDRLFWNSVYLFTWTCSTNKLMVAIKCASLDFPPFWIL